MLTTKAGAGETAEVYDETAEEIAGWTYTSFLFMANVLIGLLIFEWAWYKTRRLRQPNEKLN